MESIHAILCTGSVKTLAYAVPLLSTLSESLFCRQRIGVKAEGDVANTPDDLLSCIAVTTSPEVLGKGSRETRGGESGNAMEEWKRSEKNMSQG